MRKKSNACRQKSGLRCAEEFQIVPIRLGEEIGSEALSGKTDQSNQSGQIQQGRPDLGCGRNRLQRNHASRACRSSAAQLVRRNGKQKGVTNSSCVDTERCLCAAAAGAVTKRSRYKETHAEEIDWERWIR